MGSMVGGGRLGPPRSKCIVGMTLLPSLCTKMYIQFYEGETEQVITLLCFLCEVESAQLFEIGIL